MTKFYFLLFTALFFIGCRTATKAYDKGDYDNAVELGVKKLSKDPSDAETRDLVKSAYTHAVGEHEAAIRNLSNSSNENRYEAILREYSKLQDLYNAVNEHPSVARTIAATDYSNYIQTYRDKAADVHIEAAERWMDEGTRPAYRNAYNEYNYALRYRNTTAIKIKRDEAFNAAVLKVLVVPIQNYGSYNYSNSYQLQRFQEDIMRTLDLNLNTAFVKFYSEWDLRGNNVVPDQILEMNLGRIRIGQPYDKQSQRTVSKQVVVKEIVYKADSVVKQYATVYATITTTQRILASDGELYLFLRDPKGRTIWTDRFTGEHRWQTNFATYTGDERALSDSDKALLNGNNNNRRTPTEEEVTGELYRQIQSDLSYRLRNYFSRF